MTNLFDMFDRSISKTLTNVVALKFSYSKQQLKYIRCQKAIDSEDVFIKVNHKLHLSFLGYYLLIVFLNRNLKYQAFI